MWQLYKYQPINKLTLSNLSKSKLWASNPTVFNDPFEFRLQRTNETIGLSELRKNNPNLKDLDDSKLITKAIESYEEIIKSMSVVCFTTIPDSILMWAHYADEHKGMCLGFCSKKKNERLEDVGIYPVNYEKEYPSLDFSNIWFKDGLAKILWTKSHDWKYENEWRRIVVQPNDLIDYPGRLNEVIFGLRTTEDDKGLIRSILATDPSIHFYQITQDDNLYKLNLQIC